jgi:hypothetical protein
MPQDDIDLYVTGKDTTLKAVNMAYWNFHGQFPPGVTLADLTRWGVRRHVFQKPAAFNQPYNMPDAPRPPGELGVKPHPTGGIEVR